MFTAARDAWWMTASLYTRIKELWRLNYIFEFLLDGLLIRTCRTRVRKYSTLRRQPQQKIIFFPTKNRNKNSRKQMQKSFPFICVFIFLFQQGLRAHMFRWEKCGRWHHSGDRPGAPEGRRDNNEDHKNFELSLSFTFLLLLVVQSIIRLWMAVNQSSPSPKRRMLLFIFVHSHPAWSEQFLELTEKKRPLKFKYLFGCFYF